MARNPDRFERMVGKAIHGKQAAFYDWKNEMDMTGEGIVKLLRRQHRAYVRMVKNMPRVPYLVSDSLMRSAVIEVLKRYAK